MCGVGFTKQTNGYSHTSSVFLFSIGSQSGNHRYEDLANFGYKLHTESKKFSIFV
jgi:hypothetical protein